MQEADAGCSLNINRAFVAKKMCNVDKSRMTKILTRLFIEEVQCKHSEKRRCKMADN